MGDVNAVNWKQWPSWYSNKELSHANLRGLESYLLSSGMIADECAFGIDLVEKYESSFGATWDPDASVWLISVSRLRAVMPSGQPVWLGEEGVIAQVPQETGEDGFPVFRPNSQIDIFLSLKDDRPEDKKLLDEKFALTVLPAASPPQERKWGVLFLGRYTLLEGGGLEIARRPFVRRLCAFGPIDEGWNRWTNELQVRINACRDVWCAPGSKAAGTPLGAAIFRLALEWPFLTIPVLVRTLKIIGWLAVNPQGAIDKMVASCLEEPLPLGWTGGDLPDHLATLLPEAATPVVSQPAGTQISQVVQQLLVSLSRSVDYHAPLGDFWAWYSCLKAYQQFVPEFEKQAIESVSAPEDVWGKAVILVTRMIASRADRNNGAASHLGKLHGDVIKAGGPATPMAFFWLMKTATLLEGFPQGASTQFLKYCQSIRGKETPASDRLARYIDRVSRPASKEPITHFGLSSPNKNSSSTTLPGYVRCLILGNPGSGKRTMTKAIHDVWPVIAGSTKVEVLTAISGAQSNTVNSVDFLILTITPSETDSWQLDWLKAEAERTIEASPSLLVAIAYTKADEYGVVEFSNIRLARQGQRLGTTDADWQRFESGQQLSAVLPAIATEGFEYRPPQGTGTATTPTRTKILRTTRPLWSSVANSGRLLNGYFITAASPSAPECEYLAKTRERTGLIHLLGDYIHCRRGGT